jgi:hypothetical protein
VIQNAYCILDHLRNVAPLRALPSTPRPRTHGSKKCVLIVFLFEFLIVSLSCPWGLKHRKHKEPIGRLTATCQGSKPRKQKRGSSGSVAWMRVSSAPSIPTVAQRCAATMLIKYLMCCACILLVVVVPDLLQTRLMFHYFNLHSHFSLATAMRRTERVTCSCSHIRYSYFPTLRFL